MNSMLMLLWSKAPKPVTAEGLSRSCSGELAFRGQRLATLCQSQNKKLQEVCCSPSPWYKLLWLPWPQAVPLSPLSQDFLLFPAAWLAMSPRTVIIFCSLDSLNV